MREVMNAITPRSERNRSGRCTSASGRRSPSPYSDLRYSPPDGATPARARCRPVSLILLLLLHQRVLLGHPFLVFDQQPVLVVGCDYFHQYPERERSAP